MKTKNGLTVLIFSKHESIYFHESGARAGWVRNSKISIGNSKLIWYSDNSVENMLYHFYFSFRQDLSSIFHAISVVSYIIIKNSRKHPP
jgi:hypothetical protein